MGPQSVAPSSLDKGIAKIIPFCLQIMMSSVGLGDLLNQMRPLCKAIAKPKALLKGGGGGGGVCCREVDHFQIFLCMRGGPPKEEWLLVLVVAPKKMKRLEVH